MNARAWFYSQSFNGGTRETPNLEPPSPEVEELEPKELPSSSTGFMDRERHQWVRGFLE